MAVVFNEFTIAEYEVVNLLRRHLLLVLQKGGKWPLSSLKLLNVSVFTTMLTLISHLIICIFFVIARSGTGEIKIAVETCRFP